MNNRSTDERNAEDDSVCFYCGYPDCRCNDDDDDDVDCCEHGVEFCDDCEECDAEDYEEHMSRYGRLPPP